MDVKLSQNKNKSSIFFGEMSLWMAQITERSRSKAKAKLNEQVKVMN